MFPEDPLRSEEVSSRRDDEEKKKTKREVKLEESI